MDNILTKKNIDASSVTEQYEKENAFNNTFKKKTEFDIKNYLQARLSSGEKSKTLTIRLLPFSPEGGSPFKKIFIHTVKVNKEVSPGGWRTFICPVENKMGDKCPFCEVSEKAKEIRNNSESISEQKKFGDIEYQNKVKAAWVVRCIERGHEEDGVKFWMFNDSRAKKGVYNDIMNIYFERKKAAERKGKESNIFDLNDGKDLIITLSKDENGKTVTKVVDDDEKTPLSESYEEAVSWVNDEKKWTDVYTVKPYEYMKIIIEDGVPVFSKEKNKYVNLNEKNNEEKKSEEITEQKIDFNKEPEGTKDEISEYEIPF